jgi:hypothetical protein
MQASPQLLTGETGLRPPPADRRQFEREKLAGELWLIDNRNARMFRGTCVDRSATGLKLRIAAGGAIRVGDHYDLCVCRPGQSLPPGCDTFFSRGATVVHVEPSSDEPERTIHAGLLLDPEVRSAAEGINTYYP